MWPATGLLFMALWTSPLRNWGWLVAIQLLVQVAQYFAFADAANWRWDPLFAVANSLDGVGGALIAKRLVPSITTPQVGSWNFAATDGARPVSGKQKPPGT